MLRIPQRTSRIFPLLITAFSFILTNTCIALPTSDGHELTSPTLNPFAMRPTVDIPLIHTVRVTGNKIVGESAIRAKVPLKPGDPFDPRKTGAIIKDIYNLGYFTNVRLFKDIRKDGTIDLRVEVAEKPRISLITFEGNNNYESEKLYRALEGSRIRALDEAELPNICRQIEKAYQEKNFHHAQATGQFKPGENDTQIAHFIIEEGKKTWVRKVSFKGNNNFNDGLLRTKIFTRENWLFGFLDRSGTYHPDAIMQDRYTIENYYQSNGYLTARVTEAHTEEHDNGAIDVTFHLNEGDLYTVSKVEAPGNDLISEKELLARIPIFPGQLYSKDLIRSTMEILRTAWGEFGYIYADVQPSIRPDETTKTVAITFHSDLGNRIRLNRLEIVGNTKTFDKIIRREILFDEGDLLTKSLMDESKRRVELLGYFEVKDGVNWRIIKKSPDVADLELMLKEKKTGRFEGQLGWGIQADMSTPQGSFNAGVSASDINMLGMGIRWNVTASYSSQSKAIDAILANDWLFDRPISGSLAAFMRDVFYEDFIQTTMPPHERTKGGTARIGFRAERFNYLNIVLGLGFEDISYRHPNIAREIYRDNPTLQLCLQEQINRMFQPGKLLTTDFSFSQDFRNNPLFPSSGFNWAYNIRIGIPYSASCFGFFKNTLEGSWYTPIIEERDVIFHLRGFAGFSYLLNHKNIPYRELFHIGGPLTVRGFKFGQIGPQMLGSSLGATKAILINAEIQVPLTADSNMRGYLFYDGGAGWDTPCGNALPREFLANNSFEYRHAVGFSLSLDHPTSVRVDWGFKLDRKRRRGEEVAEINISANRAF